MTHVNTYAVIKNTMIVSDQYYSKSHNRRAPPCLQMFPTFNDSAAYNNNNYKHLSMNQQHTTTTITNIFQWISSIQQQQLQTSFNESVAYNNNNYKHLSMNQNQNQHTTTTITNIFQWISSIQQQQLQTSFNESVAYNNNNNYKHLSMNQ